MKKYAAALIAFALAALPLATQADPSMRVNRVIVSNALQQQLQNQLNVQQTQLQLRQNLQQLNLQTQMQQNSSTMQYLLLQQQIYLLRLEQIQERALQHSSHSHKAHHGS
ncbi:MAG TPA: hypothetical protein VKT72_09840 [Candidatus Baltobacteraceae bacterium]|nr:hypothetical protein [Candidatus Baltobacteraceae bacterium]